MLTFPDDSVDVSQTTQLLFQDNSSLFAWVVVDFIVLLLFVCFGVVFVVAIVVVL